MCRCSDNARYKFDIRKNAMLACGAVAVAVAVLRIRQLLAHSIIVKQAATQSTPLVHNLDLKFVLQPIHL